MVAFAEYLPVRATSSDALEVATRLLNSPPPSPACHCERCPVS
jgi:hypothetical protein